MIIVLND